MYSRGKSINPEKQEKLEGAMDAIRRKYGDRSIVFGAVKPEKEEDPFS